MANINQALIAAIAGSQKFQTVVDDAIDSLTKAPQRISLGFVPYLKWTSKKDGEEKSNVQNTKSANGDFTKVTIPFAAPVVAKIAPDAEVDEERGTVMLTITTAYNAARRMIIDGVAQKGKLSVSLGAPKSMHSVQYNTGVVNGEYTKSSRSVSAEKINQLWNASRGYDYIQYVAGLEDEAKAEASKKTDFYKNSVALLKELGIALPTAETADDFGDID